MRGMRTIVVGGGFKGLVAARLLVERGASVTLLEKSPHLGGVHRSIPWDGFQLDIGCHLFGNEDDKTTAFLLDLMRERPRPVTPVLRSYLNDRHTEGIEYPDLTSLPAEECGPALAELLEVARKRGAGKLPPPALSQTLEEYLTLRYGPRVTALLDRTLAKLTRTHARHLSAAAYPAIPASRVKLTDDAEAARLKREAAFDEVLLRSSADDTMRYHRATATKYEARCFYPATGGLGSFSENAIARLTELGVRLRPGAPISDLSVDGEEISLSLEGGETLTSDLVLWTAGAESLSSLLGVEAGIGEQIQKISLALFYYDVPVSDIGPYSWVQDFDASHLTYRASAPSRFGTGTAPEGRTYVAAEIPTEATSELFAKPEGHAERVWREVTAMGVARGPFPEHRTVRKFPVAYRFPRAGYADASAPLQRMLQNTRRLIVTDEWVFGNSASIRHIDAILENLQLDGNRLQ
jgi:phytoene dehydrogenase-like protein